MEELHNNHESHELRGTHGAHSILVNPQKLSQGLTRTFEGISIIFESLGSKLDVTDLTGQAKHVPEVMATATKTQDAAEPVKTVEKAEQPAQSEQAKTAEHVQSPEPTGAAEPAEQEEPSESAKSSISLDDITKVIVEKIKQDRGNREKIEAIVHEYGVSVISQLDEANYEAFLAELASL